jgi:hypothetical protein
MHIIKQGKQYDLLTISFSIGGGVLNDYIRRAYGYNWFSEHYCRTIKKGKKIITHRPKFVIIFIDYLFTVTIFLTSG